MRGGDGSGREVGERSGREKWGREKRGRGEGEGRERGGRGEGEGRERGGIGEGEGDNTIHRNAVVDAPYTYLLNMKKKEGSNKKK